MLSDEKIAEIAKAAGEIQTVADALADKLGPLFNRDGLSTDFDQYARGRVRDSILTAILAAVKSRVEDRVWDVLGPKPEDDPDTEILKLGGAWMLQDEAGVLFCNGPADEDHDIYAAFLTKQDAEAVVRDEWIKNHRKYRPVLVK